MKVTKLDNNWNHIEMTIPGFAMGFAGGDFWGAGIMPKICPACGARAEKAIAVYTRNRMYLGWFFWGLLGNWIFRPLTI